MAMGWPLAGAEEIDGEGLNRTLVWLCRSMWHSWQGRRRKPVGRTTPCCGGRGTQARAVAGWRVSSPRPQVAKRALSQRRFSGQSWASVAPNPQIATPAVSSPTRGLRAKQTRAGRRPETAAETAAPAGPNARAAASRVSPSGDGGSWHTGTIRSRTRETRQKTVASARSWAAQAPRKKSPETYKNRKAPPAGWGALHHPPSDSVTGFLQGH